jgi:hypothetical protein
MVSDRIIGDLERTLFNRFCSSQNLRSLFDAQLLPSSMHSIITEYDKTFNSDIRGTLLQDNLAFDDLTKLDDDHTKENTRLEALPHEYHKLLQQWVQKHDQEAKSIPTHAIMSSKFRRFGQWYQTAASSPRDSHILYKDSTSMTSAGRIRDIFSHTRYRRDGSETTEIFIIVDVYKHLSPIHAAFDLYRNFPDVAGQIYYKEFSGQPVIVSCGAVLSHFVCTPEDVPGIDRQCIHALPLDKVCKS